jgi:hypothetical protein
VPKRKKRKAREPRQPVVQFLCETHLGLDVRLAIPSLGPFSASDIRVYNSNPRASDESLAQLAKDHRMVLLSRDREFIDDPVRFHPSKGYGVLVLDISTRSPADEIAALRKFLTQRLYRHCRQHIVHLQDNIAIVYTEAGPVTIDL